MCMTVYHDWLTVSVLPNRLLKIPLFTENKDIGVMKIYMTESLNF